MDVYSTIMAGRGTESAIRTAIDRGGQAFKEMIRGGMTAGHRCIAQHGRCY